MKKALIALGAAVILVALGFLAFRVFVTDRVTDVGGMENPFITEDEW